MPSEMQERIAEEIMNIESNNNGFPSGRLADLTPQGRLHYMTIALAVMKAMREPTQVMLDAGVAYALNVTVSGAGSWSEYIAAKHRHMLDREISLAEGGSDDRD